MKNITPYDRANPFSSRIQDRFLLTQPGSTKKTYHISLTLAGSSLVFHPGDSMAILPSNDPATVDLFLQKASLSGCESVRDPRSNTPLLLRDYLIHKANLHKANPSFLRALHEKSPYSLFADLLSPEQKPKLTEFLHTHTPTDLLSLHPHAALSPEELIKPLLPLLPRFYSIASSQLMYPDEVHLTVAALSYLVNGQRRYGLGSHFLCERARIGETPIPLYLQPSHGFKLPANPDTPIILVGPGTGVAPFRAFLQERLALQSRGRNWLFFGERHRATDFYYEDFWLALEKEKRLRLSVAFSRDSSQKFYVQHSLWEMRKEVWAWLEEGAFFYVCGDALEMAKDVEAMLQKIASAEGGLSEEAARLKIKALRAEKRYLMDVY